MKVKFSPAARSDLRSIADYIAKDSPERALSFVDEIEVRCRAIADMPKAAVQRNDLRPGIRMVPFRRYLIFYTEADDGVRIERILHGARNLPDLL